MMFIELIGEGKMSNEGDKLLSEEIMEIHRFIGMFHKWLPDLAKIDTNLRFANVLPTVRALDPNATSATDFTTQVTAATLFKMLVAMGREEMRLRSMVESARATPVVNREEVRDEMRAEIRELMSVDLPTGGIAVPSDKTVDLVIEVATAAAEGKYLRVIEKLEAKVKRLNAIIDEVKVFMHVSHTLSGFHDSKPEILEMVEFEEKLDELQALAEAAPLLRGKI